MYPQPSIAEIAAKQAAGYAQTPPPDVRQSEIGEQTGRLHGSLEHLQHVLGQLGERLQPLIRPVPTAVSANKNETAPALSPIGDQIHAATRRIDDMTARVRSVLDALAV